MKKIFKILNKKSAKRIFINILIMVFLLIITEINCAFISFERSKNLHGNLIQKINQTVYLCKIHYFTPHNKDYEKRVRPFSYDENTAKDNIILLGCSFSYGDGLNDKENFGAVLSQKTGRNVLNLGICCASPREALYILRNNEKFELLKKGIDTAEYVIYTYFPPQKQRLYADICEFDKTPHYISTNKGQSLKYTELPRFISQSFIVKYTNLLFYKYIIAPLNKDSNLMLLYLKEIKKEIDTKIKNNQNKPTKFVILEYEKDKTINWDRLKKDGIKVINADDLTGINLLNKEYRLEDWHPNAKAWEVIVPALVKELNL